MIENDKMIVFTINVGSLPPIKAEAYMERLKDQFRKQHNIDASTKMFFVPTRTGESKVEVYGDVDNIYDKINPSEIWELKRQDKWKPDSEAVRDYVLLMLGAPVLDIELDNAQLAECRKIAFDAMSVSLELNDDGTFLVSNASQAEQIFREGALSHAIYVLGRIRSMYIDPNSKFQSGTELMEEGRERIAAWKEDLINL